MAESKIPQLARDEEKQFNNRWAGVRKKLTDLHILFGVQIYCEVEKGSKFYGYMTSNGYPNIHRVTDMKGPGDSRTAAQIEQSRATLTTPPAHPGYGLAQGVGYLPLCSNPYTPTPPVRTPDNLGIVQLQQYIRGDPPTPAYTPEGTPPSLSNDKAFAHPPMEVIPESMEVIPESMDVIPESMASGDGPLTSQPKDLSKSAKAPTGGWEGAEHQSKTSSPSGNGRASTPVVARLRSRRLRRKVTNPPRR